MLTPKEGEVARLAALGLSNRQIAGALEIGVGTVKIHLHHAYRKLGVATRVELAVRARDLALAS